MHAWEMALLNVLDWETNVPSIFTFCFLFYHTTNLTDNQALGYKVLSSALSLAVSLRTIPKAAYFLLLGILCIGFDIVYISSFCPSSLLLYAGSQTKRDSRLVQSC